METPENNSTLVVSVSDWLITLLVSVIPVVNIIMFFVWAFRRKTNPNKANLAKAILIWLAISIIIWAIIIVVFGTALMGFMGTSPDFIENPQY
ncbi:MAG: hypothetical protein CVU14_01705 [Bacteroidetes bacterium HGW-Bacteroidetes-9]|jgi:heme/copper-type cytochrome/quinol oxidase subunit 2|nr:MAG: hypothetical protein CVU14_01705 [Bacteroidetes bacterium HGW-Bacteroidetes-9]